MKNRTQFAGIILGAAGVAIGLRGAFDAASVPMVVLGLFLAIAGVGLIFRGHYQGR